VFNRCNAIYTVAPRKRFYTKDTLLVLIIIALAALLFSIIFVLGVVYYRKRKAEAEWKQYEDIPDFVTKPTVSLEGK
jgi:uncharacterized BrkB/YihY/UPF0761 family membrane protein